MSKKSNPQRKPQAAPQNATQRTGGGAPGRAGAHMSDAQKSEHIRAVVLKAGEDLRARHPWLRHQDAIGATIMAVSLLGMDLETPVGQLRGKVHHFKDIPVVATYHPAYLLRKPADKAKAWADLCLAIKALPVS